MEDLQSLLEKINREGVEKADAEAKRIVAEAKAKAAEIVKEANASADAAKAEAERQSADYVARAKETLSQAARDIVLQVEKAVTDMLVKILTKDVDRALADEKTAAGLANGAIGDMINSAEIIANSKLVAALKAQFAAQPNISVITDESMGSGFTVKVDGGRVEHSFTGKTISMELAKRLRPDLAELMRNDE